MVMLLAAWLLGLQAGTNQGTAVASAPGIVLEVAMPSGSVVQVTIPAGQRGSVGSLSGPGLDLFPALGDDGRLEIVVAGRAWDPAAGSFVTRTVQRQVVDAGGTAVFGDGIFPVRVKWAATAAVTGPGQPAAPDDADRCCVVCGSEVVCGCRVIAPCGDCCTASCACSDGSARRLD
jgi:hypothetical protein